MPVKRKSSTKAKVTAGKGIGLAGKFKKPSFSRFPLLRRIKRAIDPRRGAIGLTRRFNHTVSNSNLRALGIDPSTGKKFTPAKAKHVFKGLSRARILTLRKRAAFVRKFSRSRLKIGLGLLAAAGVFAKSGPKKRVKRSQGRPFKKTPFIQINTQRFRRR